MPAGRGKEPIVQTDYWHCVGAVSMAATLFSKTSSGHAVGTPAAIRPVAEAVLLHLLDTVLHTHGKLDPGAAAQVEVTRRRGANASTATRALQDHDVRARETRLDGRAGPGNAQTRDHASRVALRLPSPAPLLYHDQMHIAQRVPRRGGLEQRGGRGFFVVRCCGLRPDRLQAERLCFGVR